MSGFDWNGPIGFASLELQLEVLGLNESFLEKLKQNKSRVLDIGCGETFELVKYLRLREINAEGLDPRIKEENEYLISMGLPKSSKEMGKKIPKPDNYYNLIFSHCMDHFYNLIDIPGSEKDKQRRKFEKTLEKTPGQLLRSDLAILEAVRILKLGAEVIIYPGMHFISNMQNTLEEKGCSYEQQSLEEFKAEFIRQKYEGIYAWFEEPFKRGDYKYRTVIHKN